MEANILLESLKKEARCSICLRYFKDPVSIHCGHSFCQVCIAECWEELETNICPQCGESSQEKTSTRNRHLARMVEIAKCLNREAAKVLEENMCKRHLELLQVFCIEDKIPICLVCELSKEHRRHTVIPREEAAQEYKEQFQMELQTWKEEREKLQVLKMIEERRSLKRLERLGNERKRIVSGFEQLHQFLEHQEQQLLAKLEQLQEEVIKEEKTIISRLSVEISNLSDLISEIEEKYKQPMSEFLQDIKIILNRCENLKIQQAVEHSPDVEKRLDTFFEKTVHLEEILKKFRAELLSEMEGTSSSEGELEVWQGRTRFFELPYTTEKIIGRKVNVTLDPNSANPFLVLSVDQKSVSLGDIWQDVPDNPERFDTYPCVLGCQGFTSGRHYWEVEVGSGKYWAAGFAKESVRRKGELIPSPEEQIWALQQYGDHLEALTHPVTIVYFSSCPRRIRILLDYEENKVAFFDVGTATLIYMFSLTAFSQERMLPWLWVWPGTELRLCQ